MQLSNCYVRQYSTMSNKVLHSKETNIIFKMKMFCDEGETNTFQGPNEWSEGHKNNMQVHTMTVFLQSDNCNIWLPLCI